VTQGRTAASAAIAGGGAACIAPRAATPDKVCCRRGARVGWVAASGSRNGGENKCRCHSDILDAIAVAGVVAIVIGNYMRRCRLRSCKSRASTSGAESNEMGERTKTTLGYRAVVGA